MGLHVVCCLCNFQYIAMEVFAWAVQLKCCLRLTVADVLTIIYNVAACFAWNNDFDAYSYIWRARMTSSPLLAKAIKVMLCSSDYFSYLDFWIPTGRKGFLAFHHGAHYKDSGLLFLGPGDVAMHQFRLV